MKRARRLIRRLLIVALGLGVLGVLGLAVLNYLVLPHYGADWVRTELERALGRPVQLGDIDWRVPRGATITDLVVQHGDDVQSNEPFLEAEHVEVGFRITRLLPLRIEIRPDLDSVTVRLIKEASGEWSIADLVNRLMEKPKKTPRTRIGRLGFSRMTILITDRYTDLPAQSVEDVTCILTAPAHGLNEIQISGRWPGEGGVRLSASFGPDDQPVLRLRLDGPVVRDLQHLLAPDSPLIVHDLDGPVIVRLRQTDDGAFAGHAELDFARAQLEIEGFHVDGPLTGTVSEITFRPGRDAAIAITSSVRLVGGHVEYVPPTTPLDRATGDSAPLANVRDVEPHEVAAPLAEAAVPQMVFDGDGRVNVLLAGTAGDRLSVTISCRVGHAQVTTPAVHAPFNVLRGTITYDGTGLKYEEVVGEIIGAVVTVDGAIDAFGEPNITFDVDGERLGGHALLKVRRVAGQRLPAFQVDGAMWMDAALARLVVPDNVAAALDRLQVTGMLSFEGRVARVEPGLSNVRARGAIGGADLGVRRFGFGGLSGTLFIERGMVKIYDLDGRLYDGTFTGAYETDFAAEGMPYKLDARLDQVDIARMPLLTNVQDRRLQGRLGASVGVNGNLDDLTTSFGNGRVRVRDGYIWEFSVFDELFSVLAVHTPGLTKVVFDEVRGDFHVEGLALRTDNFYCRSTLLRLLFEGRIDLNGNLDFVVDPLFFRERGGPIRRLVAGVVNIAANVIPRALVKGTVNDPVVKPYLRPRLPILKEIIR
ncbi:MAG: hypothetical protein JW889_08260 [Verrucomicrobia bacterium]|nr:hypothetical protein [Verrucomicrobiota bacterium]